MWHTLHKRIYYLCCAKLRVTPIHRPHSFISHRVRFSTRPTFELGNSGDIKNKQQQEFDLVEYYEEVQEEGVEVPMVADEESYLRKDLIKRPLTSLYPEELVEVLRDQRAKNIVCIRVFQFDSPHPCVIICTPYNQRHGNALEEIVRSFLKRNFIIEDKNVPKKLAKPGGWYMLDLRNVVVHIMDEETRQKYDLESLYLGLEDEELSDNTVWMNEFRLPLEMLLKTPYQAPKKRRLL